MPVRLSPIDALVAIIERAEAQTIRRIFNMSDSKFTPGPWNLHPYYADDLTVKHFEATEHHGPFSNLNFTLAAGDKIIGETNYRVSPDGRTGWPHVDDMEEARANVALILKAPDLYSLAAKLAQFCESIPPGFMPREMQEIASEARALVTAIDTAEVFNAVTESR